MLLSCGHPYGEVVATNRAPVPPESPFPKDLTVANGARMDQPDLGSGDRTGLMIIRAWVEEGSREPLRVQIRHTNDVSKGFQRTTNLRDLADASAAVEGWLMDIMAEPDSPE